MSLTQCLDVLRARWKFMLAVMLLVLGSVLAASAWRPKLYTASAALLVDQRPDPLSSLAFGGSTPPAFKATQIDVIGSQPVLSRVAASLPPTQLDSLRSEWRDGADAPLSFERWLILHLASQLQVRPASDSHVITIDAQARSPEDAATLANAFAKAYIDVSLEMRTEAARQTTGFFEARSQAARTALAQAQKKLGDFQAAHGIVASDERVDLESARLLELGTQLTAVQSAALESASRQAQAQGQRSDQLQEVVNHPLLGQLKAEIGRAEAQLQQLLTRQGDNHPQLIEARAQLAELRSRFDTESRRVAGSVGVNASIQRQRQADLAAAVAEQRASVLRLKAVREDGLLLQRDVESAQRAYDTLRQRHAQASLESQATQASVQLLSPAQPPLDPSSPRLGLNALLGLVLGALTAGAAALALELRDRRVRSAEDLEACTQLPLLAALPPPPGTGLDPARTVFTTVFAPTVMPMVAAAPRTAAGPTPRRAWPSHPPAGDGAAAALSIGDILVDLGRLDRGQVRQVLDHQLAQRVPFGEAAQALGLVSHDDVRHALGRQFGYPLPSEAGAGLAADLVTLHEPFGRQAEVYRSLRSQLSLRLFGASEARPAALAVVSPAIGDGRSVCAANLAVSLAQLDGSTLLIDADLRAPRQHTLFDLRAGSGLASLLARRADDRVIQPVAAMPGLFVLPAGPWVPNPLELVERPAFAALMQALGQRFRHIVVDSPAAERGADATMIAHGCGAALVLARRHAGRMGAVQALTASLAAGPVRNCGTVLVEH
jgi:succinoglycan biosynthesis transport protein ExoP